MNTLTENRKTHDLQLTSDITHYYTYYINQFYFISVIHL